MRSGPVFGGQVNSWCWVFTFAEEATGDGQEDVFLDTEAKAVDEIVAYLDVALMKAMALRPANARHYAFVLLKNLASGQTVLNEAAADTLCRYGPAVKEFAPRVRRILKRQQAPRAKRAVERVLSAIEG